MLFSFLVSFSAIELGDELGRGAYGVVYRAKLREETIACKMLSDDARQKMNETDFLQEARTMSTIPPHPNVIQLIGFCRDEKLCILTGMQGRK
jgi:serine/threonine protein kinase